MANTKTILLVVVIGGIAWVTEPLWLKRSTTVSSIDTHISQQEKERGELLTVKDEKLKKLEAKFGKKPAGKYRSGVPLAIEAYWDETLDYPASLEEEICSPIRVGAKGWITVCRYRVKNSTGHLELMQSTYIIKNGKVIK